MAQHEPRTGSAGRSSSGDRRSVALIDRRALTRQCLARWLEISAGFKIVAVPRFEELNQRLGEAGQLDLVLVSIGASVVSEPEVCDTLELLTHRLPGVPLIIVSDREDIDAIAEAIRRGVRGYIPTTLKLDVAAEALRLVQAGGIFVPAASLLNALEERQPPRQDVIPSEPEGRAFPDLTPRQAQVLELLRQGKSNKIIAYDLEMQESTVKVHIRHIMRKLKATNRTQAAFLAHQLLSGAANGGERHARNGSVGPP